MEIKTNTLRSIYQLISSYPCT